MNRVAIGIAVLLAALSGARAIVIVGGTGVENFTAPPSDPGFANVGNIGVYLGNYGGNYWVLTATHVGPGNIVLGGNTYTMVGGSAITVLNGNSTPTDLTLFRITADPGLPTLNLLSGSNPGASSIVRMMGDGLRESTFTQWGITVQGGSNDDIWTPGGGTDKSGYTTTGSLGVRWGDSIVVGNTTFNVGTGNTDGFYMGFSNTMGISMAQGGDSGGATFYYTGGTWYLAGILSAIGTFGSGDSPDNQPANTAVFGNITVAASVANYNSFILSAIPEPSAYAILAGLLALGLAGIVRRRNAA
ncbi:MAG: hypothetical protein HYX71_07345 [Opitutae bacterium]|nr:hypothetical protein [Opitutae bacterium]